MSFDASLYHCLVEHGGAALLLVDRSGQVRFANLAAERLLGADPTGTALASRFAAPERFAAFITKLHNRDVAAGEALFTAEAVRPDGSRALLQVRGTGSVAVAGVVGAIVTLEDVTAWHAREQSLVRQAYFDQLTGLANRYLIAERLGQARVGGGTAAVADLDGLKLVNDRHGHLAGDKVLKALAERLVAALPEPITVGRVGGDEFAFLLPGTGAGEARALIERAMALIAAPVDVVGGVVPMPTLSVGMLEFGGHSIDQVLNCCDVAMYVAKQRGGDQVIMYGSDMRRQVRDRRSMAETISRLTEQNEQLRVQVRTDPLTGLNNQWTFEESRNIVFGAEGSPWHCGAVLFVDVDHFGQYNHLYGDHPAGDLALQQVAVALLHGCRSSDVVFRKGGEEFVAVLPEVDAAAAAIAAERIRAAVQALAIPHAESAWGVLTVTIGVRVAGPADGKSVDQCLADASDRVMAAKRDNRRNRVHLR